MHLASIYYGPTMCEPMCEVSLCPVPAHPAAGTQQPAMDRPTGCPAYQLMTSWPSLKAIHSETTQQVSSHTCGPLPSRLPRYPGFQCNPSDCTQGAGHTLSPGACVPASLLQPHFPSSVCACFSLPCAQPDSNIRFHHRQVTEQMAKNMDYVSIKAKLHHIGSGTHQLHDLRQVTTTPGTSVSFSAKRRLLKF